MKKNELNMLRNKTVQELKKMVLEKKLDLLKASVDKKASKGKNLKKVNNIRGEIAQILTIVREKEIMVAETNKS